MKEQEARKAVKNIAAEILDRVDKTDNINDFVDGFIGALLGIKILIGSKDDKIKLKK